MTGISAAKLTGISTFETHNLCGTQRYKKHSYRQEVDVMIHEDLILLSRHLSIWGSPFPGANFLYKKVSLYKVFEIISFSSWESKITHWSLTNDIKFSRIVTYYCNLQKLFYKARKLKKPSFFYFSSVQYVTGSCKQSATTAI